MNEVKNPQKQLIIFYVIVAICIILFNFMVMPWIMQHQIVETDYATFITMTENQEIGYVQIQSNQILFADAEME
jgi:cell division protease FtsH